MSARPARRRPGPHAGGPPMGTLHELRAALRTHGAADLERFEAELDDADLDDLAQVRELIQAYRHRVLLRLDPDGAAALARPNDDVAAELRRKLGEAGRR
ncbi:hypothetical protein GCM10010329_53240 [Streptomyces spiroverticillatus]|uniref:Uncharacterized protein n=1 Tax=Streptomyces finlayi TaxID=67296 RepID=A0A918X2M1_9ACTN|nr:hypothetical protein [Streptomyces finlayi]GHA23183.1 hypothetical protein GCM10010329_53240 [Streptomyces spiroverticillatus]GHD04736.1 hypothetical protein GCM10010334_54170 [Streptomyces finlayi]